MSISYEIHHELKLVVFRYTGTVDNTEYVRAYRRLFKDPDHPLGFDELADMSKVDQLLITADAIRNVSDMAGRLYAGTSRLTRTAVVAATDCVFGLSRMYQAYADESCELVEVFRTREEALGWLGLTCAAEV